ncbi:restriction endonuclease subunit S (plasmid) [Enterococcus faecium]|nr:restriction endonuclease subunit S [Enterococcus faecium]
MTNRAMKDSGVEWIGAIPEDWEILKYKRFAKSGMGSTLLKEDVLISEEPNSVPVYSATQTDKHFGYLQNPKIVLEKGDLVIPARGNSIGNTKIIKEAIATCTQTTIYSKLNNKIDNRFLYYCSIGLKEYWFFFVQTAIPQITVAEVQNNLVPFTSMKEQQKIAAFLDEKVSHIENIIEDTKKSIENLKAYKQSLITETVTKGLNPNVDMKDSGIEWAGEIPSHWRVNRLKRIFEIKKDIANQLGYDILSVTQKGLKIKDISSNEGQLSADYSKYQIVEENDFVMNHMDLLTGWVDLSKFVGVTSPDYRVFKSSKPDSINNLFYKYIFQLGYSNKIFYGLGQGVSNKGRWRLPTDQFLNFEIPIPPIEEQQAIAIFLNEKTSHVNLLIEQKEQLINELESYKKSFIYEYVTGKKEVK